MSQTKKTTSVFKSFGPSIQDLFHGSSVNLERVAYQKLIFGVIRVCRGHPEHSELTKMVENVLLWVSLSINHSSKFMQFCSTFSNQCPLKICHVNVMGSLLKHSVVFLAIPEKKEKGFREIVCRQQQSLLLILRVTLL